MTESVNLIGQVCESDLGQTAIVTGRSWGGWGLHWVGVTLEHGSPWSSQEPKFIRTAERDDLLDALTLAWKSSAFAAQDHFIGQFADMHEATLLLVLEGVRAGLAERASQLHRQHEHWTDI